MREEPYLVQPASRLLYSAYTLLKNNLYWPRLNGSFYRIFRMWSTCLLTTCNSWIFNDFLKEMYWKYNGIFPQCALVHFWCMVLVRHDGLMGSFWPCLISCGLFGKGKWWPYRVENINIKINVTGNDLTRLDEDILSA